LLPPNGQFCRRSACMSRTAGLLPAEPSGSLASDALTTVPRFHIGVMAERMLGGVHLTGPAKMTKAGVSVRLPLQVRCLLGYQDSNLD
jgi:hypothetical protein